MSDIYSLNYVNLPDSFHSWPIGIDGKHTQVVKDYLSKDIPDEGIQQIIENASKTLNYCPDPFSEELCNRTGLVIGKVQSGKTSTFITLTSLAFDNGYDLVLVFGGTKKPLVKQNKDRIKDYFKLSSDVIVLDTNDYPNELKSDKIIQFIRTGRKVIIVVLKTPNQINKIKDNIFTHSQLCDKPILIIDDEGDEASLNTLISKNSKSSTYKSIENLKNHLNRHCFVSVTATPQANLLINSLDILSPDFGILVDPGNGYCGLNAFHSDDTYTIKIPDNENTILDINSDIPKSFIKSLAMFFVSCAVRKMRGLKQDEKVSMLIHPSQKKVDHRIVHKKVELKIKDWITQSQNKNDVMYSELKDILIDAYNEYKNTTIPNIYSFDVLEDHIIEAINFCGIHIINGDSVNNNSDELYPYNIYVGGAMLGRGLTFNGLTITYIVRTTVGVAQVDTTQQRARWFGYKTKYLDLCRIFAVGKIINEFMEIRNHEEDLWDTIKESNQQGTSFKKMARIFALADGLRMTRRNVADTYKYTFKYWNKQANFQRIPEYIANNNNVIKTFRDSVSYSLLTKRYGDGNPYIIAEDLTFDLVKANLLDKFRFNDNDRGLNNGIINKLYVLFKSKNINLLTDVIWMRDGGTSKHNVNEEDSIGNYMVGRRPDNYDLPATYEGDQYQFRKDNHIQIQLHNIEDRNTGVISYAIAMYIPQDVVERLTHLVIRTSEDNV